jgi:hypothetical protein
MGVGALAGSLTATQVNPSRPLVFVALTDGLFALPLAFLAATPPVALLAFGALLSGAGMMLGLSVWESTLQRQIPGESLSRISSYDWFGSLAFSPLGLVIWLHRAAIGISHALWLPRALVATTLALLAVPDTAIACYRGAGPLIRHRTAAADGRRDEVPPSTDTDPKAAVGAASRSASPMRPLPPVRRCRRHRHGPDRQVPFSIQP